MAAPRSVERSSEERMFALFVLSIGRTGRSMSNFSFLRLTKAALICMSSLFETGRRQFDPLTIDYRESKAFWL